MSTPITEKEQFSFPAFQPDVRITEPRRPSDEDSTVQGENSDDHVKDHPLNLTTSFVHGEKDHLQIPFGHSPMSPSNPREESRRLDDELEMLRVEQVVSNAAKSDNASVNVSKSRSVARSRSRTQAEPVDDFDIDTTPIHEKAKIFQPVANPATKFAKILKSIHESFWLVRYFFYIAPITLILLIPLLLGAFLFRGENGNVGGVELFWFSIWLEIVWLTLWAGRILAKLLPWPMGLVASIFTNNDKKWRDLGKALEIPATLFFWWLAIEISFLPTMTNHHFDGDDTIRSWENTVNKVIVSVFVAAILNFVEKIIIQLIASSFHLRAHADRIDINKFQIGSLVKMYIYSKEKIAMDDSHFEDQPTASTGARTPMAYINKAQKNATKALHRVGDVAGKVAGDFTGKAVTTSTHPNQVILQLLNTTGGSQVLARRLYRTFATETSENVSADDLRPAFINGDEADAAFSMFDKDLNGDISMEEFEAVCVEVGRERKAITASLKDLDSVIAKLDDVLIFFVAVIIILVFISLISTSAQAAITSAGSAVLALSWLFSATAQEFLQSIIFVFVKHPFDVGDRVTVYGNTGSMMRGDDYFVKEISLLYTEFKKMEGHVVQAPNSYLNTLFILNQRRSGGLAEAVPVTVKFGTSLEQIEGLRNRLLEFVTSENREYQKNILTEITTVFEAYSVTLNVVFFYKSNWQNELLRLQRRNKFICALMVTMQELGIEGPRQKLAGQSAEMPMYLHGAFPTQQAPIAPANNNLPPGGNYNSSVPQEAHQPNPALQPHGSILRRARGESISAAGKRVDFSLGASAISSGDHFGDVYEDRSRTRLPRVPERSNSLNQRQSIDTDNSMARTTSRDSNTSITHRNRFFPRRSRFGSSATGPDGDEGTDISDLEAGYGAAPVRYSLDRIPEAPTAELARAYNQERAAAVGMAGAPDDVNGRGRNSGPATDGLRPPTTDASAAGGRIDPRTGIVSPQAVARDSALERGELPMAARVATGEKDI